MFFGNRTNRHRAQVLWVKSPLGIIKWRMVSTRYGNARQYEKPSLYGRVLKWLKSVVLKTTRRVIPVRGFKSYLSRQIYGESSLIGATPVFSTSLSTILTERKLMSKGCHSRGRDPKINGGTFHESVGAHTQKGA